MLQPVPWYSIRIERPWIMEILRHELTSGDHVLLLGLRRSGKSLIAEDLVAAAASWYQQSVLVVHYRCPEAHDSSQRHADALVQTIESHLRSLAGPAQASHAGLAGEASVYDASTVWRSRIIPEFERLVRAGKLAGMVVVVDGLDQGEENPAPIDGFLAASDTQIPRGIQFVMTSRILPSTMIKRFLASHPTRVVDLMDSRYEAHWDDDAIRLLAAARQALPGIALDDTSLQRVTPDFTTIQERIAGRGSPTRQQSVVDRETDLRLSADIARTLARVPGDEAAAARRILYLLGVATQPLSIEFVASSCQLPLFRTEEIAEQLAELVSVEGGRVALHDKHYAHEINVMHLRSAAQSASTPAPLGHTLIANDLIRTIRAYPSTRVWPAYHQETGYYHVARATQEWSAGSVDVLREGARALARALADGALASEVDIDRAVGSLISATFAVPGLASESGNVAEVLSGARAPGVGPLTARHVRASVSRLTVSRQATLAQRLAVSPHEPARRLAAEIVCELHPGAAADALWHQFTGLPRSRAREAAEHLALTWTPGRARLGAVLSEAADRHWHRGRARQNWRFVSFSASSTVRTFVRWSSSIEEVQASATYWEHVLLERMRLARMPKAASRTITRMIASRVGAMNAHVRLVNNLGSSASTKRDEDIAKALHAQVRAEPLAEWNPESGFESGWPMNSLFSAFMLGAQGRSDPDVFVTMAASGTHQAGTTGHYYRILAFLAADGQRAEEVASALRAELNRYWERVHELGGVEPTRGTVPVAAPLALIMVIHGVGFDYFDSCARGDDSRAKDARAALAFAALFDSDAVDAYLGASGIERIDFRDVPALAEIRRARRGNAAGPRRDAFDSIAFFMLGPVALLEYEDLGTNFVTRNFETAVAARDLRSWKASVSRDFAAEVLQKELRIGELFRMKGATLAPGS